MCGWRILVVKFCEYHFFVLGMVGKECEKMAGNLFLAVSSVKLPRRWSCFSSCSFVVTELLFISGCSWVGRISCRECLKTLQKQDDWEMAIVTKVWYLQFDKDAVWQKMVNLCRKLAAFRQKNQANLMFCAGFPLSLQKKSKIYGKK